MARDSREETRPCIVIGGGSSISEDSQATQIKALDFFKIGGNEAAFCFDVDAMVYFDDKYERENRERITGLSCKKYAPVISCQNKNKFTDTGTEYVKMARSPTQNLRDGLLMGNNTGTFSLSLAIALGFREIFLLGCDCKLINGNSHFHGGYGHNINDNCYGHMVKGFEIVGNYAKTNGIKVWNCSYDSHLDYNIFPYDWSFNG